VKRDRLGVKHRVDPVKPLTEFNILLLKPASFLSVVVTLRHNCTKLLPKGGNLSVKLLIPSPGVITLSNGDTVRVTLTVKLTIHLLNLGITLDQGITQALDNIAFAIQVTLGTLKHILDISVAAISLGKLITQSLIIRFQTTNSVIEIVNLLLKACNPISLGAKGCNLVNYRLEELFHLLLRMHI